MYFFQYYRLYIMKSKELYTLKGIKSFIFQLPNFIELYAVQIYTL